MARSARPVRLACLIGVLAIAGCTSDSDSNSPYPSDESLYGSRYDAPYDFRYGLELRYGDGYCDDHSCRTPWP